MERIAGRRSLDASAFARYEAALVSNDAGALDALFADDPRTIRYDGARISTYMR